MLSETLRDLRYARLNSKAVRFLLERVYRPGRTYTIPFGRLRGLKLRYDRAINFHAMLGLWEAESLALLSACLERVNVRTAYDVGANIGMYTLFLGRTLPRDSAIYAFEPSPAIAARLRDHLAINHQSNATVVEAACSDAAGTIDFYLGHHHHASSVHEEWAASGQGEATKLTVAAVSLDDFIYGSEPHQPPDFIKMDIEGGGTAALPGATRCLQQQRPLVLIESHTPAEDTAISHVLTAHGYDAFQLDGRRWVTRPAAVHPDPEGVWGTLLLCPSEQRHVLASVVS